MSNRRRKSTTQPNGNGKEPSITAGQAIAAINALPELIMVKMPGIAAFAVRRLARELGPIQEDMRAEWQKLCEAYGVKDDEGKVIMAGNEPEFETAQQRQAFYADWNELLAAPVEVNARLRLQGLEQIELTPNLLLALGDLIEE